MRHIPWYQSWKSRHCWWDLCLNWEDSRCNSHVCCCGHSQPRYGPSVHPSRPSRDHVRMRSRWSEGQSQGAKEAKRSACWTQCWPWASSLAMAPDARGEGPIAVHLTTLQQQEEFWGKVRWWLRAEGGKALQTRRKMIGVTGVQEILATAKTVSVQFFA